MSGGGFGRLEEEASRPSARGGSVNLLRTSHTDRSHHQPKCDFTHNRASHFSFLYHISPSTQPASDRPMIL